jgi:hypothetical protein
LYLLNVNFAVGFSAGHEDFFAGQVAAEDLFSIWEWCGGWWWWG